MKPLPEARSRFLTLTFVLLVATCLLALPCHSATNAGVGEIKIVRIQGTAKIQPKGLASWILTQTNQTLNAGDHLSVGNNSRVDVLWSDRSVVSFDALTEVEILVPNAREAESGLHLIQGVMRFFHRDTPGRIRVITAGADAGVLGTEFVMSVQGPLNEETTTVSVFDGRVRLSNLHGILNVTNNQQAVVVTGKAPKLTAGFVANNIMQWCFYYPGVLDLKELNLSANESETLKSSLEVYRAGDLLGALANYPASRQAISDAEKIYHAAILLSVGQVEQTEAELTALPVALQVDPLVESLRTLIAAVKRSAKPATRSPQLATELLAASYYEQSRATGEDSLKTALELARRATTVSPQFGFAWERAAELEFGFGRVAEATRALDQSLELSPRNAQAMALKGFLLAADNKISEAKQQFDLAIATDAALGNAWLGRGLCCIRLGDIRGGREDLLIAAALEPQRSLLRSYLAKAYATVGDANRASHELTLAKNLDPADPTAWLYSALLKEQNNRFNEGIGDLEHSQELNDNRCLYRSRLLLDQDHAVRSSSLANLYEQAGMPDVSLREAARAVGYDYANYSSHLFLSESYNALRDPTRFNLRYETPWFNELLLANLLSPVGGTPLSQNLSQQEYSRLFEHDRIGLSSSSEYRSDGQLRELASQYGNIGNTAWALDLDYQHNDGVRPNNELDRLEWYTTIKQQLTPQDSLMLLAKYQDYHSGDNFQYYQPTNARPNFRFDEVQKPILIGGYHHEWGPGIHTLLLGGRLENDQRFSDLRTRQIRLVRDNTSPSAPIVGAGSVLMDVSHRIELEIYDGELQQVFETPHQTLLLGARWQDGKFDTQSLMANPNSLAGTFTNLPVTANPVDDFERWSAYVYETVKLPASVRLTAGLTYDNLTYPKNFRAPPVQNGVETREQFSPKASLVWELLPEATVRAIYARSLGGVSLDESYQLEPTQLGGFVQTFRSMIPESLVGSVSAPDQEIYGGALDLKFATKTYFGLQVEKLQSEIRQNIGVFDLFVGNPPSVTAASSTRQNLDYQETKINVTLNQLISDEWSVGAQYSFVHSELETSFPQANGFLPTTQIHANLHRANLFALYNHRSGFFARAGWDFYFQNNSRAVVGSGIPTDVPDETLQQLNLVIGYRFPRQRGDITFGILNLTGEDYRLNPVTPLAELPRERILYVQLRFRF